jgi:hypothetical protein
VQKSGFFTQKFIFLKMTPLEVIYAGNRLRAFPNHENAFLIQGKIGFLKRKWSFFSFLLQITKKR